jgi:hypothetical protein
MMLSSLGSLTADESHGAELLVLSSQLEVIDVIDSSQGAPTKDALTLLPN